MDRISLFSRSNLRLSTKMVIFFIILIFTQGILTLGTLSSIIRVSNLETQTSQAEQKLKALSTFVQTEVQELNIMAALLAGQQKIMDYTYYSLPNMLTEELETVFNTAGFDTVGIYSPNGDVIASIGQEKPNSEKLIWFVENAKSENTTFYLIEPEDSITLYAVHPIIRHNVTIGHLAVGVKMNRAYLKEMSRLLSAKIIFAKNDTYILSTEFSSEQLENITKAFFTNGDWDSDTIKTGQYIISYLETTKVGIPGSRFYMVLETTQTDLLIRRYTTVSISLIGVVLLLALTAGLLFYRITVFVPLQKIMTGIKQISSGNLQPPFNSTTSNEFGSLAIAFNKMCGDLANREKKIYNLSSHNTMILENISAGIITLDQQSRITAFNHSAELIFKMDTNEVLGHKVSSVLPEQLGQFLTEALDSHTSIHGRELDLSRKGREKQILIRTSLLKEQKGDVVGLLAVLEDLTEVRKLEEKLHRSSRLAGLGEMAAGVAHQIRNPLAIMKVSTEMLLEDLKDFNLDNKSSELTQMIIDEIDTLNVVVSNFLDFARPRRLNKSYYNLEDILKFTLNTLPLHKFASIRVEKEIDSRAGHFFIDKDLIIQVLSNLIMNALEATSPGGRICIRIFAEKGNQVIEIQDWGKGINKDHLSQIFDPFFTTKDSGTGLGLSIVHRIVEGHNGTMEVESTTEKGTIFKCIF